MPHIDHAGIYCADLGASLRFYVEGLGLQQLVDVELAVDLTELFGVRTEKVRTIFLGNPADPGAGSVELLDLGVGGVGDQPSMTGLPQRGLFLLSFQLPVLPAIDRLTALGYGGSVRTMATPAGGIAATAVDPDGVVCELLDAPLSLGG
ncbi:MAG TPA: VOC family protein [Mycobacteriales bacterium]|nr:VOC family protein [Mycobacteriales bacterium]